MDNFRFTQKANHTNYEFQLKIIYLAYRLLVDGQ